MDPLENISELINDYYKYMIEKAYPYDYIQLYATRTSASDEAVVILNKKGFDVSVEPVKG